MGLVWGVSGWELWMHSLEAARTEVPWGPGRLAQVGGHKARFVGEGGRGCARLGAGSGGGGRGAAGSQRRLVR